MKYIFFDIDDTLIPGGYGRGSVPESTKKAIELLRKNGHFTAIATGRAYYMAKPCMEELGFEHMVCDGGHGVVIDKKLIEPIEPLNKEWVCDLIDECEQKGFPWGLSLSDSNIRLSKDKRFQEFTQDIYLKTQIDEKLDPKLADRIFKAYVACTYPKEYELESLKKLTYCRFSERYFFVEPCDKARGIRKVVEHFGGNMKDVVVFGDQKNDLSMFSDQWLSIAMGNAVPELKEKATYVTDAVDKDGIYNACVHFGLI